MTHSEAHRRWFWLGPLQTRPCLGSIFARADSDEATPSRIRVVVVLKEEGRLDHEQAISFARDVGGNQGAFPLSFGIAGDIIDLRFGWELFDVDADDFGADPPE